MTTGCCAWVCGDTGAPVDVEAHESGPPPIAIRSANLINKRHDRFIRLCLSCPGRRMSAPRASHSASRQTGAITSSVEEPVPDSHDQPKNAPHEKPRPSGDAKLEKHP